MQDITLNPKNLLQDIGVAKNVSVADFGCGPGIFAIPAAELTKGTVHCFDVLTSALEAVDSKAQIHNLANIEASRVNLELEGGSGLSDESIDFVIMRKIILQNSNRAGLFSEAYRILKNGGSLLVVGWTQEATFGPAPEQRLPEKDITVLGIEAQFSVAEKPAADPAHYAIVFRK